MGFEIYGRIQARDTGRSFAGVDGTSDIHRDAIEWQFTLDIQGAPKQMPGLIY
jgi:hypothetical protein